MIKPTTAATSNTPVQIPALKIPPITSQELRVNMLIMAIEKIEE
jgi:hypothetical protein